MIRLVLVEDSDLDAELISASLAEERIDCHITRVVNEVGLRAALAERRPDLILSDFRLPTFDGMTALRIARAGHPDVPFIFVSGALGEELAVQCLKSGATDYVLKQRLERLPTAVRLGLAEAHARRERHAAEEERRLFEEERARLLAAERTLRRDAEAANQAKDQFLAMLSHELRTPLNAILGWAQMLNTGRLDDVATRRAIDVILRNAKLQAKLIEDVLDVSRIISGKLRLEVEPVDLRGVVLAATESARVAADAKGVRIDAAAIVNDGDIGTVSGDPARLQQVFGNLLGNAIKFTPPGGHVRVFAERQGDAVTVAINDDGAGISADFLPHVFERFRQRDGSTRRHHGGLGLGLAIVRHLVQVHHGSVAVTSAGEGHGSTFRVTLPLIEPQPHHANGTPVSVSTRAGVSLGERPSGLDRSSSSGLARRADVDLGGIRVLVVDDEHDARDLIVNVLAERGAKVSSATGVREAMQRIECDRPDVIVSDVCMPGEDGFALIARIRAADAREGRRTPVVALTAFAGQEHRRQVFEAGFSQHIEKPYDPADVVAAVVELARLNGAKGDARTSSMPT